jgi:hypothetical protein
MNSVNMHRPRFYAIRVLVSMFINIFPRDFIQAKLHLKNETKLSENSKGS